MKDEKQDTLNEILKNTARTEQRARNIEKNMERFQNRYIQESKIRNRRINELEDQTRRNSLILTAWVFIVMTFLTALSGWMFGLV